MIEPLGLLQGTDAADAVRLGLALPLPGGLAFTMARLGGRVVPAAELAEQVPVAAPWAGLPARPLVMGIVNVTPDSFSDGGERFAVADAVASGLAMVAEGADILDVGGESTRPGAEPVEVAEEMRRVLPVIAGLAGCGAPVSVDTRNAATMAAALAAGAAIVNDVSGLGHDPESAGVVAQAGCPVVLMHMRGTPGTMAGLAQYGDLATEVAAELGASLTRAHATGVRRENVALDPGVGFAKQAGQNPELLRRLPVLLGFGGAEGAAAGVAGGGAVRAVAGGVDPAGARRGGDGAGGTGVAGDGGRLRKEARLGSAQTRQRPEAFGNHLLKQMDSKGLPLAEFEAEPQPRLPAVRRKV